MTTQTLAEVWCHRCDQPATNADGLCDDCRAHNGWIAKEQQRNDDARVRKARRLAA